MHRQRTTVHFTSLALILLLFSGHLAAATKKKPKTTSRKSTAIQKSRRSTVSARKKVPHRRVTKTAVRRATTQRRSRQPLQRLAPVRYEANSMAHFLHARVSGGPWTVPTYAESTLGDWVDGEDLEVRRVAVQSLGPYNGAVVVVDPTTGRILTMVNQKLALSNGFQPCSTIKIPASLAALSEGVVTRTTPVTIYGRTRLAMTEALAKSNNHYFANLGVQMGYDRFAYYAKLFGYGEKAGLDIPGEQAGYFPGAAPINGGVGMLTSFGETIRQTPLQLAALMSAIANGGSLYYLQYPRSPGEAARFVPRLKRRLEISRQIPDILPGMLGAVMFGTARRAGAEESIAGKTGTCTDGNTHLGWFGAFNNMGDRRLVVVVMLTGGRGVSGGPAAGVAGEVFRRLGEQNYFTAEAPITPPSLVSTPMCCSSAGTN